MAVKVGATYSAGGTKHALVEWSIVEDVRTDISNNDPQILTLMAQLRRLHSLVYSKGLAGTVKKEKRAA